MARDHHLHQIFDSPLGVLIFALLAGRFAWRLASEQPRP
jgi:cytochrome b561